MAKIEKLPSGSYRIRVYDARTGKRKSVTAKSRQEVKRLAAQYIANIDDNINDRMDVRTALMRYVNNRSAVLSPSTELNYLGSIKRDYEPIAHYDIDTITSEDIQIFINEFSVNHSPKTCKNVYALLKSAITAVRPDKVIRVTLPASEVLEYHVPTDKDIKELVNSAQGNLKKAILLASVGTLRRGEICAVEYSDISGNVLHVHSDMVLGKNGWTVKKIPKTAVSNRYIEFPREIIEALGTGEGRIVTCRPNTIESKWCKLRDKLGLECRLHDLRHYAASIMHALGVPDQYIMERGGWSSDTVLKAVYRNVLEDKKNEFANKTNEYMKNLLSE